MASVSAFSSLLEDSGEDACNLTDGIDGNIIGEDPRLGELSDNGGPTKTHALLTGSPAINAGDNDLADRSGWQPTHHRSAWLLAPLVLGRYRCL